MSLLVHTACIDPPKALRRRSPTPSSKDRGDSARAGGRHLWLIQKSCARFRIAACHGKTKVLWIVTVPSETFPPLDVTGKPLVEFDWHRSCSRDQVNKT